MPEMLEGINWWLAIGVPLGIGYVVLLGSEIYAYWRETPRHQAKAIVATVDDEYERLCS